MCGRFVQFSDPECYASRYAIDIPCIVDGPRYNSAPTQAVLAIRAEPDGRRALIPLRWGLVPHWSKGIDHRYSMINARAETVHERPAFRDAFRRRRCLIPTEGFYEWQTTPSGKQPHLICREDRAPFTMAGLWERWQDPTRSTEQPALESCTIIVTEANALVAKLHDRMPVILPDEAHAAWLDPNLDDPDALRALLQPLSPEGWTAFPVSRAVNNPRNNGPELIAPLEIPVGE
jgi:putative SOS response-associated peptidase YedK